MAIHQSFEHWLQSRLTAHGFPVGAIDGIVGVNTVAALRAFQRSRGLEVTGRADERTVEALRASAGASAEPMARPKSTLTQPALSPILWPHQSQVPQFYGEVGKNQTQIEVPFYMVLAWDQRRRVSKITVHQKVALSASRVLQRISTLYSEAERRDLGLHLFGGSLNVRRMRGGTAWSMHSWGIALDFDPERNQLKWGKPRARLSHDDAVPFWQAWEAEGWVSLGREANYDWMHVQAARI